MKIQFYLKNQKAKDITPIEFTVQGGYTEVKDGKTSYTKLRRSTGLSIKPRFWNENKQEVSTSFESHELINNRISDIKNFVEKLTKSEVPTIEKLKQKLDVFFNGEQTTDKLNFVSFAESIIKQHPSEKRKKTLNQTLALVVEFSAKKTYPVDFDTITVDFYDKFQAYMLTKNYTLNNRSKHIKSIKYFLNEALLRKLHTNLDFKTKKFQAKTERIKNIYLSDAEIKNLFDLDLRDKPRLDRVRDLFLIGCYTGLRFSDFTQILPENIKGNIISIRTQKTNTYIKIPIRPELRQILDKYQNNTPRAISNQKMNDFLKELCQLAGFNESILKYEIKGKTAKKETLFKWQLVCTHTARRSFATNCYKAGIPAKSIMLVTGHKTETEFSRYIGLTEDENAEMLLSNPYFSGANLKVV